MLKSSGNISNSSWNLANILIYPAAFLALTPFFINKLGESDFGIWMLLNSYVYIAVHIVSFGMGNSIIAHIAESLGKKSQNSLFAYINISTKTIAIISMVTVIVGILWFLLIYISIDFFGIYIDKIIGIATILIAAKFWELLYQSILKGFERYDLASIYNIISKMMVLVAQLALVLFDYGLFEIFISNLIINMLMVMVQAIVSYRLLPGYKYLNVRSKKEEKDLFHFGLWTWLQTIISVLAYQIDRFVIAIFLGPAITGYYILASTIVNHIHMAYGAVVSWLLPKISRKKESDVNITAYFTTLRSFLIGFGLLSIIVALLTYEPVFKLWLGEEKFAKMGQFFRLFLGFEVYMLMTIVPLFYLNAIKMLKFITSMELMYKTGIIAGLFIAFAIVPTGDSLIIGQYIALVVLVPVEYYFINKKLLFDKWYNEALFAFVPALVVSLMVFWDSWYYTVIAIFIASVFFIKYYLNPSRFNLNLLKE
jgi:O-antigen/teichoic acid export membrane protein